MLGAQIAPSPSAAWIDPPQFTDWSITVTSEGQKTTEILSDACCRSLDITPGFTVDKVDSRYRVDIEFARDSAGTSWVSYQTGLLLDGTPNVEVNCGVYTQGGEPTNFWRRARFTLKTTGGTQVDQQTTAQLTRGTLTCDPPCDPDGPGCS